MAPRDFLTRRLAKTLALAYGRARRAHPLGNARLVVRPIRDAAVEAVTIFKMADWRRGAQVTTGASGHGRSAA
jgi:hypothetical protein